MASVEMTDTNINDLVAKNDFMVIDVWATWCAPCTKFTPIFEKVSEDFPDILFAKVEADENPLILQFFKVQSIPTILVVKDKDLRFQHRGFLNEQFLRQELAYYVKN